MLQVLLHAYCLRTWMTKVTVCQLHKLHDTLHMRTHYITAYMYTQRNSTSDESYYSDKPVPLRLDQAPCVCSAQLCIQPFIFNEFSHRLWHFMLA